MMKKDDQKGSYYLIPSINN